VVLDLKAMHKTY